MMEDNKPFFFFEYPTEAHNSPVLYHAYINMAHVARIIDFFEGDTPYLLFHIPMTNHNHEYRTRSQHEYDRAKEFLKELSTNIAKDSTRHEMFIKYQEELMRQVRSSFMSIEEATEIIERMEAKHGKQPE